MVVFQQLLRIPSSKSYLNLAAPVTGRRLLLIHCLLCNIERNEYCHFADKCCAGNWLFSVAVEIVLYFRWLLVWIVWHGACGSDRVCSVCVTD